LFKKILAEYSGDFKSARVEVWRQNKLRGIISRFPSIALRFSDAANISFDTYAMWKQNHDMSLGLVKSQIMINGWKPLETCYEPTNRITTFASWRSGQRKNAFCSRSRLGPDLSPLVVYFDDETIKTIFVGSSLDSAMRTTIGTSFLSLMM